MQKSSQNISGILMQCSKQNREYKINFKNGTVSVPFVDMTLEMMRAFVKIKTYPILLKIIR